MRFHITGKGLTIAGTIAAGIGTLVSYLLERTSYESFDSLFEGMAVILIATGLFLCIAGLVWQGVRSDARTCFGFAASFVVAFPLIPLLAAADLLRYNMHNWSAWLVFPFFLLLPFGFFFLIAGAIKSGK